MNFFDDSIYDDGRTSFDELIAQGEYKSEKEDILKGFKVFQKKYVYKNVVLQMILVMLGLLSQIMAVISAGDNEDVSFSYLLIVVCIILGIYVITKPKGTFKRLDKSLGELEGTIYKSEIYTDKIKISTLYDPYNVDPEKNDNPGQENENIEKNDNTDSKEEEENNSGEDDDIPATIIHLNNNAVEIVDCPDMYVVYIKKVNVFVIPKKAFKPYEITEIKNRLSNIMGVRYKEY